ncbi:MAG: ATP-binding cassette domain-containing protein [Clostridiales bacterium]|nr:ATP-binding cassette domain-containing protein [Clostridiales bacterium]
MGKLIINLDDYESKLERLNNLIEKMSSFKWTVENAIQFCKDQGMKIEDFVLPQFATLQMELQKLTNYNYKSMKDTIVVCQQQTKELKCVNFDDYNESYQNYINNILSSKNNQLNAFCSSSADHQRGDIYLKNLIRKLDELTVSLNRDVDDLFEHFRYGNKNYVIFGKNGSGKTTLLKQISESMFKSAIVVPANRTVMQSSGNYVGLYTNYTLNQMLKDNTSLMYLTREINNKTLDSYENGKSKNNVLRTRFYEIFSTLGLDRDIVADKEFLFLKGDQIDKYSMDNASDGEKSIAYLIMATLLAPQNSFIFIDEPERHLNGALMRNLFNKLESERPDLIFIYLTHNIDFVESRKNVALIYLEKSEAYKKWKFKKIEDYSNISLDVILSIEGTKKDIIFCEGTRSSIDCKVLECLFPEYEIQPVSSCEQVKLNTKGINGKEPLFRRKAFGLIDNDYMQAVEIDSLRRDHIFAIGYNEWENFIIRSEILEYINSSHLNKDLSSVKGKVIEHIKKDGKTAILSDFITKRYTKMLYATKLSYSKKLNEQLDAINNKNKGEIMAEVQNLSDKIDSLTDYDELVSIVPAKMLLKMVAKGIGLDSDDDYVNLMVKHLKQNKDFNLLVKNLLNINFTNIE